MARELMLKMVEQYTDKLWNECNDIQIIREKLDKFLELFEPVTFTR